jgi:high-affinity nickel-transport protein
MLTLLGWLLGLLNGMRHALEPDHVAAISTLVAEQSSGRRAARFALLWGLGHAAVLLVVGGGLVIARRGMPPHVEQAFELGVAGMLVLLGGRAIRKAIALARHGAAHEHMHATRPMLIGVVHGLAGSGAITAIVLAKLPDPVVGLVFIALYGLGATLGMALLAGFAGVPLASLARRSHRAVPVLLGVTGLASLVLGIGWGVASTIALLHA